MKYFRPVFVPALLLAACSTPHQRAFTGVSPLPAIQAQELGSNAPAPDRINGLVGGNGNSAQPTANYGTAPAIVVNSAPAAAAQGDISLDFADTDIRTVVDQILGNLLRVNYTIDPAVKGSATLRTVVPLSRAQLIPILQTLLGQNNAELEQSDGIYRVVPQAEAAASGALAADASLAGGTVVPLRYASATELAAVLQPYIAGGGKIIAAPAQNALIVAGDAQIRETLVGLIKAFDIDALAGQSYELFPATSGDAKDFATAFSAALNHSESKANTGTISVVPLERIGAVLVIAQSQRYLAEAGRVYAVLNQMQRETVRSWHVYYVENGRANDAAYILQQAFTPDDVTAQPTAPSSGQLPSTFSGQSSAGTGAIGGGLSGSTGAGGVTGASLTSGPASTSAAGSSAPTSPDQSATSGANALLGPLSATSSSADATSSIRIIPDNQTNSLMIYATAQEDDQIDAMLNRIDIPPVEVRIDATVAEVDLDKQLQYGTQFFFKSGGINSVLSNATTSTITGAFPGFVIAGSAANGGPLAISALQAVTTVNVLSSPELMVLNGQQASLEVGSLVPYLSQTSQSTLVSGSPVINSVDYRQTGVILQVTPHVGSNGLVTLDVSQEVSAVQSTVTTTGLDSPTFSERAVTSRIAMEDGQTIGLAGLISDNDSHTNSGIPFIKNIPLLGDLFATQNNQRTRTELLVLITPHVVRRQLDATELTQDMVESLPDAAAVPAQLQFVPPSNAADPDQNLRSQLPP